MRQYWINYKGKQDGPMTLEQRSQMGVDESAYVWHSGLPDWVKITQLPELQGLYEMVEAPAQAASEPMPQYDGQQTVNTTQPYQPQADTTEPCPPTNLVWAIITTLLCCLPSGIVAIYYALKVSNKYREGDIEGAKRASETGAWWCIATIILGILSMPLGFLIMSANAA